ncbi:MAG: hypothetical protein CL581_17355 [Alteromonadaceae bacterium]|nr:hypothetical protein [Alteromonadaceae bacterium]
MATPRRSRARSIQQEDLKTQLDEKYRQVREFFSAVTEGMSPLEKAAIASTPVPLLGDVLGLSADMEMYFTEPESRTFFNVMMTGASLLPFVPPVSAASKIVDGKTVERVRENVSLFKGRRARVEDISPGQINPTEIDPRFPGGKKARKLVGADPAKPPDDAKRVSNLNLTYEARNMPEPDRLSIVDLEGRPFIVGMSDRTAAGGLLTGVNDTMFDVPINLRGGQDYMFDPLNQGQVWASARTPISRIEALAKEIKSTTGQDPLYLPFRMTPAGGDYATMTTETMLEYARKNMSRKDIREANRKIRKEGRRFDKTKSDGTPFQLQVKAPEFLGLENIESIGQVSQLSGDQRKMIQQILDVDFRKRGSLGMTEARLAVGDPRQFAARDAGLQNVGLIDSARGMIDVSGHPTYSSGIAGQGLGLLKEDIGGFELFPELSKAKGILDVRSPAPNVQKSLQMSPYSGVITSDILRAMQNRGTLP